MLRVGLTGDLGSGKSTVLQLFAQRGAVTYSSDEMARTMMQPGQPVYDIIVKVFGPSVVAADKTLDRRELARLAFTEGRAEELNSIVHPAVLQEQARQVAALATTHPDAIAVVESALIFSTKHGIDGRPWRDRFDQIVLVTAPEAQKVHRFIARLSDGRTLETQERARLEADARRRLALQADNETHASECLVIENNGSFQKLEQQVDAVWNQLKQVEQR